MENIHFSANGGTHCKMGRFYIFFYAFLIFILLSRQFVSSTDDDNNEEDDMCECIGMAITGDAGNCTSGAIVLHSLRATLVKDENDQEKLCLVGRFEVIETIKKEDDIMAGVQLELQSSSGGETVYSTNLKFCELMEKEEDPFKDMVSIFGGKCPIEKSTYEVKLLCLDLDVVSCYLTPDFIGKYILRIVISKVRDIFMCMEMKAEVDYMEKKCSSCPKEC